MYKIMAFLSINKYGKLVIFICDEYPRMGIGLLDN